MPDAPSSSDLRKILVRGVNWLGDAVMTTPALQRLRERFPLAHITLLTHEKLRDLWRAHPSLDSVIEFFPDESPWRVAPRLRAQRFDAAVVLPNAPRPAVEVWLAGIPRRIGYVRPWRNWLLNERVPSRPGRVVMTKRSAGEVRRLIANATSPNNRPPHAPDGSSHQIHEYLHLMSHLGTDPKPISPALAMTAHEADSVRARFGVAQTQVAALPIIGLNPGAQYGPAKRWPLERFIAAALQIQKRIPSVWLVFGGGSEIAQAAAIESALRGSGCTVHNLAGKTSLRELMALLKSCRVLLTNDSGPMHVAAALGCRAVVPFGSTSPELTGPGLPGESRHYILTAAAPCSPCFRRRCPIDFRCMTAIPVERAVEAALSALLEPPL